jgi:hypothetical protein
LNHRGTISHIRVLLCRLDDPASHQLSQLAAFELSAADAATLQPDAALDALQTTTHTRATAMLRRVLQAQSQLLDAQLTAQYRQPLSPRPHPR